MPIDAKLIEELNFLIRYRMTSTPRGGIQISQAAETTEIAEARRLFNKGLIECIDGGVLTDDGRQAVDSLSRLLSQLSPPLEPI